MKRTLLTTLLTLFAAAAFAQRGGVTATVVDADTGESVVGAVLTLTPVKTPEKKQYFTSAFKGAVSTEVIRFYFCIQKHTSLLCLKSYSTFIRYRFAMRKNSGKLFRAV